ncbi:MAG TPA: T9SS type A sorting domain-containing protein [Bacteroidia bacterium]|nr:T9SS type A sorting domain-containing protein [Bacteroidia bacterium]
MKALLLIMFCSFSLLAQFPNPYDFNTASNATNTGTLSVNSNDLHWSVAITNSLGPYVAAVSCGNASPFSWVNSPYANANWISYPHTCSSNPAEHSCLFPYDQDMFYRLLVNLPASNCGQAISSPNAYCLSFDFYADNSVYMVSVNGNTSYLNPSLNPYYDLDYAAGHQKTISLCNYWQAGTNTVIVQVKSGADNSFLTWEGFLAQYNATVNLSVGSVMAINPTVSNVKCFGASNGSATLSISGGSAPYTYTWLPSGGSSLTATGLTAGVYTVLVSSSNSCTATKTLSISQPLSALSLTSSLGNIPCYGQSTTLNIAATGGTNPYLGTGTYTLSAGPYSYTIADANTCTAVLNGTLSQPPVLQALSSPGSIACNGGNTTVTVSAFGGTSPYSGTGTFTHSAGAFTHTISDAHNCIASVNGTLNQPPVLLASSAHGSVHCVGGTATINVNANGGTPPYSGTGTFNHSLGTYTYTVTDNNNCSALVSGTIAQGEPLAISVSSGQIRCPGENQVYVATGGQSYTWNPGNLSGASVTVNPQSTTMYTVTGITSPGCTSTFIFAQVVNPCLGLQEKTNSDLTVQIFPNPADDNLTILTGSSMQELILMNAMGTLILRKDSDLLTEMHLDMAELSPGIYFLRIKTLHGDVLKKILRD